MSADVELESDWWRRALAGEKPLVESSQPQAGYYQTRAFRNGPALPAQIWREGPRLYCLIAGKSEKVLDQWPYLAGRPITAQQHRELQSRLPKRADPRAVHRLGLDDLDPPEF